MGTVVLGFALVASLLSSLAAGAQPAAAGPRIGYLSASSASSQAQNVEALRQGLRELGYGEGQNIAIEYRYADGNPDRVPGLAAELVGLRVDVIVVAGTQAALPARDATRTIPIVMGNSEDPVAIGLVKSLARPGGNVTGLTDLSVELSGKRLELLKEAVPRLTRVAVLWRPALSEKTMEFRETETAARTLRLSLQSVEVRDVGDLDGAFATMTRARAGALVVYNDPLFSAERRRIVELAARHRLPTMHDSGRWTEAGSLMSYAPNRPAQFRRVAAYVDKILRGAKPAELPVEQPTLFELIINLKTAKALGLAIPMPLLQRADRVIQ